MLQDISPHLFDNQYHPHEPKHLDRVLICAHNSVLVYNVTDDFAACQQGT